MNEWTELPAGDDVTMQPGYFYAAIASVSKDYDDARVRTEATKRGMLILDWGEQGDPNRAALGVDPDDSHRLIACIVKATKETAIPWAPSFLWIHPFHLVRAWIAPPAPAGTPAPPGPTPAHAPTLARSTSRRIGMGTFALAAGATLGAAVLISRRRRTA
jgi:hypothetical protein